jgi:hypothetical protein
MIATAIIVAQYFEFNEITGSKKLKEIHQQLQCVFILVSSYNFNKIHYSESFNKYLNI